MKIHQKKISNKHNDVLFYEGSIASIGKYWLVTNGDIEIYDKDDNRVYARGKHYADDLIIENDDELSDLLNYKHYRYEYTNWFEVIYKNGENVLGDVVDTYDKGIDLLKTYHKEKIYG